MYKNNLFYATFIPGLQNLISQVLKERLADVKIHKQLDGAVLFETAIGYDKLNFFCFNNIFAVISVMEYNDKNHADDHVKAVLRKADGTQGIITQNSKKFRTFRMVFSRENTPAAVDEKIRMEIEKYITSLSGLKADRGNPDTEFWFLYRKEKNQKDFSVFMKRLTLRPSWEKTLHKGELPPPLAWAMCRLARLAHNDIVLDPFCGYGAVPDAALKYFHIKKFIACDHDKEAALYIKTRFKNRKKEDFIFYQNDFCELPSFMEEKSIDAIVTDPPWGQYEKTDDAFYKKMFEVFDKLLKKEGRATVLCANKEELLKAASTRFSLKDGIPILLSGKKTVIFQFVKN